MAQSLLGPLACARLAIPSPAPAPAPSAVCNYCISPPPKAIRKGTINRAILARRSSPACYPGCNGNDGNDIGAPMTNGQGKLDLRRSECLMSALEKAECPR